MRSQRGKAFLARLGSGEISEKEALDAGFFECLFYDEATNTLSNEGCSVVRITETSLICECSHLTNFVSFFNKGAEVLSESNYGVWLALPQITVSCLKTNIGFYIACSYWLAFLIIGALSCATDRKYLRGNYFELLYQATHSSP